MLKYLLFFAGIVVVFLVVRNIEEGFQTKTVDLYFNVDSMNKPTFVKSSDPRVKFVSSAVGGTAVINIDKSLGTLKSFNGAGWSQANKWIPLHPNRLDNITNGLNIKGQISSGTKFLRNPTYNRKILLSEVKLPQQVTNITLGGLYTGIFALGTNVGPMFNGQEAKIKILLTF